MRTLLILLISILRSVVALTRSREEQAIVELTLRQQLAVYTQNHPRRRPPPPVLLAQSSSMIGSAARDQLARGRG